jgi:anti-sigma B factor antagonist
MKLLRVDREELTILRIEGALDALSAPLVHPIIETLVAERRRRVVVDLGELSLIDSSGVGALVSLYKRLHEQGGLVRAIGVRGQPLAIFELLRLDVYFCAPGSTRSEAQAPFYS